MQMTKNRLEDDKIKLKKLLSENEDVDIAKTIMDLKMSENVYKAALSSGSRIIQPSLVDFIK
jgi:flagellar hook-associated protein 3 FlgL